MAVARVRARLRAYDALRDMKHSARLAETFGKAARETLRQILHRARPSDSGEATCGVFTSRDGCDFAGGGPGNSNDQ